MKKILIYTVNNGKFFDTLYHSLADAINECGFESLIFYVNEPNGENRLRDVFSKNDIMFSIGSNAVGISYTSRFSWLKDIYRDIIHLSILDDAPYNTSIAQIKDIEADHLYMTYRDRSHLDFLNHMAMKSKIEKSFFLPFGAIIKGQYIECHKDIDVIFSGKYYGYSVRNWNSVDIPRITKLFMNKVADILEHNPITVDEAFSIISKDYEMPKENFFSAYSTAYEYIKCYRRNKIIQEMIANDIPITVCSASWNNSKYKTKINIIDVNRTEDVFNLYKRSKILLQDMAEFNDGSHCRIGDGTLCGSVIVSEYSKYVDEKFDKSDLVLFKWNNLETVFKNIKNILKSEYLRKSFIEKALIKVNSEHRSINRFKTILDNIKKNI